MGKEQSKHFLSPIISEYLTIAKKYWQIGEFAKAMNFYHKALQVLPNDSNLLYLIGITAAQFKDFEKAIQLISKAITIHPTHTFYNSLGNLFWLQKQSETALKCYQQALILNPQSADAYNNMGIVLGEMGQFTKACTYFENALRFNPPQTATIYGNLALAQARQGKLTKALAYYQQTLSLQPRHLEAYTGMGKIFKDLGMIASALQCYQQALALKPACREAFQNWLYTLNFSSNHQREAIFLAHQKFNQQFTLPLASDIQPHFNHPNPPRLKIGYVSPEFRKHSLTYFIEPLLAHHNRKKFEIFCYHTHPPEDEVTQRLQKYVDHWINCATFSDETLTHTIRNHQIDILIDLAGHTAHNRLLVFARKPAPIQVFHTIGYSNTTGLTAIDYRITDHSVDPAGAADLFSSETLVRMPHSYYCYQPPQESPPVGELPALEKAYLTFGSCNRVAKLNDDLLKLWAQVLHQVTHSKLLILSQAFADLPIRELFQNKFKNLGIDSAQVILDYAPSTEATLQAYHQIDIGLDTYPFNGATTTCQALWMGVPVITLVGDTPAARAGLSLLSTIGLPELIAYNQAQYVDLCLKLAYNLPYLQTLRQTLRLRLQSSPLMDGATFTHHLEEAYQKMWKKWCATV